MSFGYRFFKTLNTRIIRPHKKVRADRILDRHYSLSDGRLENPMVNQFYAGYEYLGYFIHRTHLHIGLVNQFAELLGREFPLHDIDKLTHVQNESAVWSMYTWARNPNSDFSLKSDEGIQNTWQQDLEYLGKRLEERHKLISTHHPEYWEYVQLMPKLSVDELVCDYCAMGAEIETRGRMTPAAVENAKDYFDNKNAMRMIGRVVSGGI